MSDRLLAHQADLLGLIFFLSFAAVALWEAVAPRRATTRETLRARWPTNLLVAILNTVLLWVVMPLGLIGLAAQLALRGWGLMPWLGLPDWIALVLSLAILDATKYAAHRAFHRVGLLWRIHQAHHADPDYDCTTGLRFHPLEAVVMFAFDAAVIVLLGAPPAAILIFQLLLSVNAFWAHANVRYATRLDDSLRLLVVTPELHRTHHSVRREETDSNFGSILSIWDRFFGTWRPRPSGDPATMAIGLAEHRDPRRLGLPQLLLLPFVSRRD